MDLDEVWLHCLVNVSADSLNDTGGLSALSDSLVVYILFFSQTILTLTSDIVQLYLVAYQNDFDVHTW